MADISYKRSFHHVDWIDNEDVVQAGTENGFNARFHALEAEFDQLSLVIGQLASAVSVSPTTTLTFAPSFLPNLLPTNLPAPAWAQNNGSAVKLAGQPGPDGYMPLQLPDGLHLQTMTVFGKKSGTVGPFAVQLVRQAVSGGQTQLIQIALGTDQPDSFQVTSSVPLNQNLIDNKANKYLVTARMVGADPNSTAELTAVQILCARS
jgi:hypothetical protein